MTDPLSVNDLAKAYPLTPVGLLKGLTLNDGFHTTLGAYSGATNDRIYSYLNANAGTWQALVADTWSDLSAFQWGAL